MTYLLDTSVIIDSLDNLTSLSKSGENKILITDVVLNESDHLKNSLGAVGYMARKFNNFLQSGEVGESKYYDNHTVTPITNGNIVVDLISQKEYKENFKNNYESVVNDRRILETVKWANEIYEDLILVSNDVAFRTYAISLGLKCQSLKITESDIDKLEFVKDVEIEYDYLEKLHLKNLKSVEEDLGIVFEPNEVNVVFKLKNSDHEVLANVINGKIEFINEDKLRECKLPPRNKEQLFFSNLILNHSTKVILSSSPSGSGKTAQATACALKLIDNPNTTYEKIVYIRNPIDSVDKDAYIGFKKGDMDDKMGGYFTPINDALETFALNELRKSRRDTSQETIELKISEYIKNYNITFPYIGNLRGSNLSNAVIIIDEAQNFSLSSMQLVLTRVSDSSKVIIVGDINQVDSIYLSKQNNGLSFLINETKNRESKIKLFPITLRKSVRGEICEWAEELFSKFKYF
ncbi:MAG: PhoH family protein [Campylobacterales bacterium]|nr:PhoH family protein [Campylobacterales bacterium]